MKKRRKTDVDLYDIFQEKLNIMQEFLRIHIGRVTVSACEEMERNSKAFNRRGIVHPDSSSTSTDFLFDVGTLL